MSLNKCLTSLPGLKVFEEIFKRVYIISYTISICMIPYIHIFNCQTFVGLRSNDDYTLNMVFMLTKFRKVYKFWHTCTLTKGITMKGNLGVHCLYNHINTSKSLL